jgi:hypothetical protein
MPELSNIFDYMRLCGAPHKRIYVKMSVMLSCFMSTSFGRHFLGCDRPHKNGLLCPGGEGGFSKTNWFDSISGVFETGRLAITQLTDCSLFSQNRLDSARARATGWLLVGITSGSIEPAMPGRHTKAPPVQPDREYSTSLTM